MPSVTVSPGNLQELSKLKLNSESLQSAYEWAMRTMCAAPYTSAQLEFDKDGKIVDWNISWIPARSDWDQKREAYYKHKLAGHFAGLSGQWAVLNSDHCRGVWDCRGCTGIQTG